MIEIDDDVCLAALRGWAGYPKDADLSPYQQAPETKEAWRRAIRAALMHLHVEHNLVLVNGSYLSDLESP